MAEAVSEMRERNTFDARAVADIDTGAIAHNCATLKNALGEGPQLCAVVKADGYGHGAVESARAALDGGATWLAVVTAAEAKLLRDAGIHARLLVMGALDAAALPVALTADADLVVWNAVQLAAIAAVGAGTPRLHVKYDSGMGRLGASDADLVVELADSIAADDRFELAGLMTHFATADDRNSGFFDLQLERFNQVVERVKPQHPSCIVHASNSAAVLRSPQAHFDMARCGIAIYGLDPFNSDPADHDLRPALELTSYVAEVKQLAVGDSVGYGRSWIADGATEIAVLPIGYGDGYRRGLSNRAEAIVGGRRCPVVGTVSMDNITVDLGLGSGVVAGDPALLIGRAGGEQILAEGLAESLGTINYEITCGLSSRVPRRYRRGGGAGAT